MEPIDWEDAFNTRRDLDPAAYDAARFAAAGAAFREARMHDGEAVLGLPYGTHLRERVDLFRPHGTVAGLVVYVHGGYWRLFDRTDWSYLARGALARGWAVAFPGYVPCPEGSVPAIGRQVALAIEHLAAMVRGPIRLVGHSAGGQVVTRLVSEHSPLPPGLMNRIERVVSISGLHDLVPLLQIGMNEELRLTEAVARAESPARLRPGSDCPVTAWVGGEERPEFLRQSALLRESWGARLVVEPGRHHFNVIEGLETGGPLLDELLDGPAPSRNPSRT